VDLHDDGWAIRSLPPGRRDLGQRALWERSLARSVQRRQAAAARRTTAYRKKQALISAALLSATVLAPVNDAARAQGTEVAGTSAGELLRIGARGPAVADVQRMLGIPADGVFGRQTRGAVRAFQAAHGLEVDGVVGPQTLGALGISGAAPAVPGGGGGSAVAAARTKLGAPYALGGVGPTSWDCSGLTQWAFAQAGVTIPRTSFQQASVGVHVDRAAVQAGDLVFFDANGPGASHVGIATSNGTAISATSHGVREHALSGPYWGEHYYGARRVG
jgi:peptidoglycan DL-endopeptidase CwlO